jgi:nitroalkane oxidase
VGVWDIAALPAREQFSYWHEVICQAFVLVGVSAYDTRSPIVEYLHEALAYPLIEGSNIGVRRRQLQELLRTPGYDPLAASGMS